MNKNKAVESNKIVMEMLIALEGFRIDTVTKIINEI